MIVTKKPIFSGINEKYWDSYAETHKEKIFLPEYWTTSPIDSLLHSKLSVKRHGSKMLVLCLSAWNSFDFEFMGAGGFDLNENTEWYHRIKMPNKNGILTPEVIKKELLEIYRQNELDKLVEKYCDNNQKDFYQRLKEEWKREK